MITKITYYVICLLASSLAFAAPDLTKSTHILSPGSGAPGDSFTMAVCVINRGDVQSEETQIYFYFDNYYIGEISLPSLGPDETSWNLEFPYIVPDWTFLGYHEFSYWIDAPELVSESDESNNQGSWTNITISKPDLTKSMDILSPGSGAPGDSFTMAVSVVNQGVVQSGKTRIYFYFDNYYIGEIDLPSLGFNETSGNLEFPYTVPDWTFLGYHEFSYWIDAPELVSESDEDNNRGTFNVWIDNFFKRGDANADGATDISDAVAILVYLFLGDNTVPCEQAGDANDDGAFGISDVVYVLSFLFLDVKAMEPPVGNCGVDPTGHNLPCDSFPGCV